METFITVEEARKQILAGVDRLSSTRVFLSEALGAHTAQRVEAPEDSPRFDNSSRDGFALRWEDIADGEVELDLVGESAAGAVPDRPLRAGEAMPITTGGKMPEGADTVVMQENCQRAGETLTVPEPPEDGRGAWVRHAGSHLAAGEAVVEPGDAIGPAEIGALASFRTSRLDVYRRPRVAVVSTGNELVDIDQEPGDGEIVNSNAHLLATLIREAGGEPLVQPAVPDNYEATRDAFKHAIEAADMVVSSGGVSVGAHDEVRGVVDELTGGMEFWKIRMKPGKPLAFGTTGEWRNVPILGLPGNPNSGFVCFHQFVAPALEVAQGADPESVAPHRIPAILGGDVTSTPHRRHYLAGRLTTDDDGTTTFQPASRQSSGNVALFCRQDAFGIVPEGVAEMTAGEPIEVELI
jgi:molybdopterin molybdotransferase